MPSPADQPVTLPTATLAAVALVSCGLAGGGWGIVVAIMGRPSREIIAGLIAASVVLAASLLGLLLIQPWKPRPLYRWPLVWIGGSFARMFVTLGGTLLLYSATPYGTISLWLAVVVAYLATLVGETRVYATHMKRFAPAPR